ncbi:CpsD/CapB family tyrosine-protein kinase [Anaerosacchariphilus polymeriproducens]|uniref:non-specific protein-tyrosine kinase n=1 Tax=Anaerosacchariphilus polymeriproducens TaxID=1812858 RepID=A0A371AQZ4_9FIRM|nr:CpsD/CapB family tyrosine-protein kinase [Anaerosacchariphilus polymeriproducens]RDU21988.1 tyrosine protein kinase [Anaerosacchariphilus polymeriproducens]
METIDISNLLNFDFQRREAFNTLRTNIQFCGNDIKVIGITSCSPNEGKSSISLNLAVSLAEADKKVIFVDGDLRNSVMIARYRVSHAVTGLSHYLSGINMEDDFIYPTNIKNLDLILSGPVPPNPSELFGSQSFSLLIKELKESYDYIIIDTPPLGSVIDSAVISRECDGMLIVIEANAINYKFAQRVKEQLDKTGCKILGTVLNKVDLNKKGYMSKHYGANYGRYYNNEYSAKSAKKS